MYNEQRRRINISKFGIYEVNQQLCDLSLDLGLPVLGSCFRCVGIISALMFILLSFIVNGFFFSFFCVFRSVNWAESEVCKHHSVTKILSSPFQSIASPPASLSAVFLQQNVLDKENADPKTFYNQPNSPRFRKRTK